MFPLPWGWCQTTICSRGSLGGVLRSMVVLPFILLTLKWDGDTSFSWAVVFIPVWTLGNSWKILGAPIACPLKVISKRQRKGWEPSSPSSIEFHFLCHDYEPQDSTRGLNWDGSNGNLLYSIYQYERVLGVARMLVSEWSHWIHPEIQWHCEGFRMFPPAIRWVSWLQFMTGSTIFLWRPQ